MEQLVGAEPEDVANDGSRPPSGRFDGPISMKSISPQPSVRAGGDLDASARSRSSSSVGRTRAMAAGRSAPSAGIAVRTSSAARRAGEIMRGEACAGTRRDGRQGTRAPSTRSPSGWSLEDAQDAIAGGDEQAIAFGLDDLSGVVPRGPGSGVDRNRISAVRRREWPRREARDADRGSDCGARSPRGSSRSSRRPW